jgi:N-acetylneuraminic acid mutarotase
LNAARDYYETATLLPNGKVLLAGGSGTNDFIANCDLYDPESGTWTKTGALNIPRSEHTATLLPNGKVLVAGGRGATYPNELSSAELYDPESGTWTVTGSMNDARYDHSATLLPNGKVLVAGGTGIIPGGSSQRILSSAELYDPDSGTWTTTGRLDIERSMHTATLLPNGKVLVAGGYYEYGTHSSAELYDPISGTWRWTGWLASERNGHTATLLPNGKVLVAAGYDGFGTGLSGTELYDPVTESWTATGVLNTPRWNHTATLLLNGKVMIAGGDEFLGIPFSSVELYDPETETWTVTGALNIARFYHTATLLPNGQVLIAGGWDGFNVLASAELYDVGLGFNPAWQPQIASLTLMTRLGESLASLGSLNLGDCLTFSGFRFRGISEASGGNGGQDSPSDYPVTQLRSLESGQTWFLLATNWSPNSYTSAPVWGFPPGYALVTVFANGIPSTSSVVNISVPIPTVAILTGAHIQTNGAFQLAFTNSPGALFGILATTNLLLPLIDWTVLGGVTEISPGQFRFIDRQATNNAQCFYRVFSP